MKDFTAAERAHFSWKKKKKKLLLCNEEVRDQQKIRQRFFSLGKKTNKIFNPC